MGRSLPRVALAGALQLGGPPLRTATTALVSLTVTAALGLSVWYATTGAGTAVLMALR